MNQTTFITAAEIKQLLNISESKAYSIIRTLNEELDQKGFMVIPGRISRQYFSERFYGMQNEIKGGEQGGSL